jgi:hypothetical protein
MLEPTLCWGRRADGQDLLSIGTSEEGRPLSVILLGNPLAPLRVLIMAGQHGDETPAMQAASAVATWCNQQPQLADVHLAVLPCLNPDGAAHYSRYNAQGVDLNRDHQRLASVEVRALHAFVRQWRPHLIVDLHVYPPRRRHLLRQGLVFCHDLFVDVPTNPAIRHAWPAALPTSLLATLIAQLNQQGYLAGRYTLIRPSGKVRHSTPDIADARNGLALRYGIFTILLEGRQPQRRDPPTHHDRVQAAFRCALTEILAWAQQHREALCADPPIPRPGDLLPMRAKRVRADTVCTLPFADKRTGIVHPVGLPGPYLSDLQPTRYLTLPAAYAVPQQAHGLLKILEYHGFQSHPARHDAQFTTQLCQKPPSKIDAMLEHNQPQQTALLNYQLFPVTQPGGQTLALFLEPDSRWRLSRHQAADFIQGLIGGDPLLRIIA